MNKLEDFYTKIIAYQVKNDHEAFSGPISHISQQFYQLSNQLYQTLKPHSESLANSLKILLHKLITPHQKQAWQDIIISPTENEINKNKTRRYFAEQAYLYMHTQTQQSLEKLLQTIKLHFKQALPAPSCFISYAWPTQKYANEAYLQSFLIGLYQHLNLAGIHTILDIKSNHPDASIPQFANQLLHTSHVLLILTESLKDKHEKGTAHVMQAELSLITDRHNHEQETYGYTHIYPVLISGEYGFVQPPEYMSYHTVRTWRDRHYLEHLKDFIEWVYLGLEDITEAHAKKESRSAYHSLWRTIQKPILQNNQIDSLLKFHINRNDAIKSTSADQLTEDLLKQYRDHNKNTNTFKADSIQSINNLPLHALDNIYPNQYQSDLKNLMIQYRVICIAGAGGSGKSVLATEAIRQTDQENYKLRYYLNAKSDEDLFSDLLGLYRAIYGIEKADDFSKSLNREADPKSRKTLLLHALSKDLQPGGHYHPGILLLDNCQNETPFLRQIIATLSEIKFLITTRNQRILARRTPVQHLSINAGWSLDEKMRFVTADLGEQSDREALANYLPYPLGLKIAVNTIQYIKITRGSYHAGSYLSEIKSGRSDDKEERGLRDVGEDPEYRQTLIIDKAIDLVKAEEGQRLLQILAYLAPIPVQINPTVSVYISKYLDTMDRDSIDTYFAKGLELLQAISLVDNAKDQQGTVQSLTMHELVQDIARRKLPITANLSEAAALHGDGGINSQKSQAAQAQSLIDIMAETLAVTIDDRLWVIPEVKALTQENQMHVQHFLDNIEKNNDQNARIADLATDLGNSYTQQGHAAKGIATYERCLRIQKILYSDNHFKIASTLTNLGSAYGIIGDIAKQILYQEQALVILEAQHDKDEELAITLDNLGSAYSALGDYAKQIQYQKRALVIKEALFGKEHFELAPTLTNLGSAYGALGDYAKQIHYQKQALTFLKAHYGKDHFLVALTIAELGVAYGALGNRAKQIRYQKHALAILEAYYNKDHFEVGKCLANLGYTYKQIGDNAKQIHYQERALSILKAHYGKDHFAIAPLLESLGSGYSAMGNRPKEIYYQRRALSILKAYYGKDHFKVANTLANLGFTYGAIEDSSRQIYYQECALAIQNAHYGKDHVQVANTLFYLSLGHLQQNNLALAESYLTKAHAIFIKHYSTEVTIVKLAKSYLQKIAVLKGNFSVSSHNAILLPSTNTPTSPPTLASASLGSASRSTKSSSPPQQLFKDVSTIGLELRQATANTNVKIDAHYKKLVALAIQHDQYLKPSSNGNTPLHWALITNQVEKYNFIIAAIQNKGNSFLTKALAAKNKDGQSVSDLEKDLRLNNDTHTQRKAV